MEFEHFVLNLKENTVEDTAEYAIANKMLGTPREERIFVNKLLSYCKIRIFLAEKVALLLKAISDKIESETFIENIVRVCLTSTRNYATDSYAAGYRFNLLRKCYDIGFIHFDDIYKRISFLFKANDYIKIVYAYFLVYFGPELSEKDDNMFSSMLWFIEKRIDKNRYLEPFSDTIKRYREAKGDFEEIREVIKNVYPTKSIPYYIMHDDVSSLVSVYDESDPEALIEPSLCMPTPFYRFAMTYIEFAAFTGSVNCFKYLLLNGQEIHREGAKATMLQLAIAGGNLEIIKILYQNEVSFEGSLITAALFNRYELFDWIERVSCQKVDSNAIKSAVVSNSVKILQHCIDEGEDPNQSVIDENGSQKDTSNLINIAAKNGSTDCLKLLLNIPGIVMDRVSSVNFNAITYAITFGKAECAKVLLNYDAIPLQDLKYGGLKSRAFSSSDVDTIDVVINSPRFTITKNDLEAARGNAEYYTDIDVIEYIDKIKSNHA